MAADKPFNYHQPSPEATEKIVKARRAYDNLYNALNELEPQSSRYKSLAVTALEESSGWFIKGIVVNDPNSEVIPL